MRVSFNLAGLSIWCTLYLCICWWAAGTVLPGVRIASGESEDGVRITAGLTVTDAGVESDGVADNSDLCRVL